MGVCVCVFKCFQCLRSCWIYVARAPSLQQWCCWRQYKHTVRRGRSAGLPVLTKMLRCLQRSKSLYYSSCSRYPIQINQLSALLQDRQIIFPFYKFVSKFPRPYCKALRHHLHTTALRRTSGQSIGIILTCSLLSIPYLSFLNRAELSPFHLHSRYFLCLYLFFLCQLRFICFNAALSTS